MKKTLIYRIIPGEQEGGQVKVEIDDKQHVCLVSGNIFYSIINNCKDNLIFVIIYKKIKKN